MGQLHIKRLRIPDDDSTMLAWVAAQHNPSMSLRIMVRDWVREHGVHDYLATPVEPTKRRRASRDESAGVVQATPDVPTAQMAQEPAPHEPDKGTDSPQGYDDAIRAMMGV